MSNTLNHDSKSAAAYFVLGLAAGGAAVLLFAPFSGQETRGRVKQSFDEGTTRVTNGVNEGKKRVADEMHRIDNAIQAGKAAYQRA